MQAEARYREAIKQDARAFAALKRAYELNRSLTHIALRLARVLAENGKPDEAVGVLTDTLSREPSRELRFELGKILSELPASQQTEEPTKLFEHSFDPDDRLLFPRLYLLREYWRSRQNEKFRQLQKGMRQMEAPRHLRLQPNLIIKSDGIPVLFTGRIRHKEADYCFIALDGDEPDAFLHRRSAGGLDFDALVVDAHVSFSVGFSTNGATAMVE